MLTRAKRLIGSDMFRKKLVSSLWSIFRLILLIGITYVILSPLLSKLSLLFMDSKDLGDLTVKWVPRNFTFENIKTVSYVLDYGKCISKSILICGLISLLQVASCTMAAYSLARFRFWGRDILFALVIGTLVIPPQTYVVTLYTQFQRFDIFGVFKLIFGQSLNVLDSPWPFILLAATGTGIRAGLYIFVTRQIFRGMPKELEEAAKVDGAGVFSTFVRIMLPNVIPTVVLCFILSFVWQWNDTFYASLYAPRLGLIAQKTSQLGVLITSYLGSWDLISDAYTNLLMSVGYMLGMLPLLILFIFGQRFFIQGIERTGLVG